MTRQEITDQYDVKHGVIVSPGKFEGEPVYAPYFWDLTLNASADVDDGDVAIFKIDSSDVERFPELEKVEQVSIASDDNGFVKCIVQYREG